MRGALLVVGLAIAWAAGRDVAGEVAERKPFAVDETGAEAELKWEYFRHETRMREGVRTLIERSILSQLVRLHFGGYSLDPRFLRYRLDLELENEFLDETFETPLESLIPPHTSTRADRLNYDLLIQLLPQNRESLSLWARRRDYRLKELLFDRFSIEQQVYGARFDTRWRVAPFSIMVERRETFERGLFEEAQETADNVVFRMNRPIGESSHLDIDYEYLRRRRVTTGELRSPERLEIEEEIHRADLYHEYRFGQEQRSSLASWLSFLDQAGTFPFRNALGRERLVLYHRPTLQTDYGLTYQESEIGARTIKTAEAEAGLHHRLYENLVTRLEARLRHTDEDEFDWNELELLGNWSYWRHTPWGRLMANYLIHDANRDASSGGNAGNVLTNRFELLHEFNFPLRLYYRFADQRLDVDVAEQIAITNSTEHVVGYEIPWRQWAWLQEYRRLDDTLGKTETFRSELRGAFGLPWRSTLNMRLAYDDTAYHGRVEDTQSLTGQMGYILPFGRTGLFEIDTYYADRTGIVEDQEWQTRGSLRWRWRKLKFDFSGQHGLFENQRSGVEREGMHLLFTVTREF